MPTVVLGADQTGDGKQDLNITGAGAQGTINGAIFADAANVGSGTGQYNTFLAIQDTNDPGFAEAGFNTDDSGSLDPSNPEIGAAKTQTIKFGDLVVTTINNVQYVEFRVDLNESNSDAIAAQISLDQFRIYSSTDGTIEQKSVLDTQHLLYDMDAGQDVSVLMSDIGSTGSGTDDYSVLVPLSDFVDSQGHPLSADAFIYLYIQMGAADGPATNNWGASATFEEWNIENGVSLTGIKFNDANGNGVRDPGEAGVGGVTIFIDANNNGTLDPGERSTVTAADGSYTFTGVKIGATYIIDEVTPAGQIQSTGNNETITISSSAKAGTTFVVDPIGNFTPNPALNVTKVVSSITGGVGGKADSAGDVINYTINVQNTGNVQLTGITVSDPNATGGVHAVLSGGFNTGDIDHDNVLDVGETWHYTATHTVTQAELDGKGIDNTGAIDGDGDDDNTVTADSNETGPDTADASAPLAYNPGLDVTKAVTSITGGSGGKADSAGDVINYTIDVQNTGNITLTGITVTDPNATTLTPVLSGGFNSGDTDHDGKLDVGETWHYTATHTVTQAELDGKGIDITGAIDGDGDDDNRVTADSDQTGPDTADASAPLAYNPSFNIVKDVSSVTNVEGDGKVHHAGDVINYVMTVTNTGNISLTNVTVTDPYATTGPTYQSGDSNTNGKLDVGEVWTYTATHTVLQSEIDSNGGGNGTLENVATAHSNETPDDSDDAEVPLAFAPNINIIKDVDSITGGTGGKADSAGDIINYALTVQNTGNISLTNVQVTDPNADSGSIKMVLGADNVHNIGDTNNNNILETTETWHYTATHTVTQGELDSKGGGDFDIDNTATVTSTEAGPDSDDAEAPLVYNPDLNVTKGVSSITGGTGGKADSAGDIINYSIDVQNTGNITLTGITVTDPNADTGPTLVSGDTNSNGMLDVGETWHYTATHVVTQEELDGQGIDIAGNIDGDGDDDNEVTADSNETGPDTADASAPLAYNPDLNVTKAVSSITGGTADGKADSAGDVINYEIHVQNTGNITLTGITVTDPNADTGPTYVSGDTNHDGNLDVGETWVYNATHTVTQDELDGKGIDINGDIDGDGDDDNEVTADSNETAPDTADASAPLVYAPGLNVTKEVTSIDGGTGGKADSAGDVINYHITVENTGNISLTGVTVDDVNADGGSILQVLDGAFNIGDTNHDGVLSVGETWEWTAQHTVTQAELDGKGIDATGAIDGDGDDDNLVTADSNETGPDTATASAPLVYNPAIHLEKGATVPGGTADAAGEKISYTLDVTNTGNITLTGIGITDPYADGGSIAPVLSGGFNSGDTNQDGKLDLTETWHYTATHTVTQAEIDTNGGGDGILQNTATVHSDQNVTDDDDASVPVAQNPAVHIEKNATVPGGTADAAGEKISYTLDVSNTGNMTLTGIVVSDPYADALSIQPVLVGGFNSGDTNQDGKLDLTETWHYTATHTVTQAEIDTNGGGDGILQNTATVNTDQNVSDDDDANVPVAQNPAIHLEKGATVPGGTADAAGEKISYTLDVSNTGNMTLTGINITDPYADSGSIQPVLAGGFNSGDTNQDGKLDLTETWHYTATHTVTQAEIDTNGGGDGILQNTATVTSTEGATDDDDASVPVAQSPAVDLVKYVDVGFGWDDANSGPGPQNVNVGADVDFKVTVHNTGNVTLTDVDVTDQNNSNGTTGTTNLLVDNGVLTQYAIDHGAILTGDTGNDHLLGVGETWTITYTSAFDPGQHLNTANVTDAQGATDQDSAYYFSLVNLGPCPRTPGFWQNMKNGGLFWDNVPGNEKHAGEHDFPDGELIYPVDSNHDNVINGSDQVGLLIGDWNKNGITDAGENTLFVSYANARTLINASNKQLNGSSGDGKFMLGRDMVAAWLNFEMGAGFGDGSDPQDPHSYLNDAINFMQIYGGATAGGLNESFDTFVLSGPIKSSSPQWKQVQPGVLHSGAQLHAALDYYNNTGMTSPGGTLYANCDNAAFDTALTIYEAAHQTTSVTTGMAALTSMKTASAPAPTSTTLASPLHIAATDFGNSFELGSAHHLSSYDLI